MTSRSTEEVIGALVAEAQPVRPLPPPLVRAARLLVGLGLLSAFMVYGGGNSQFLANRYSGHELLMIGEVGSILVTAILAVCGAFALSVPGSSRTWLVLPLPFLALWVFFTGAGCYANLTEHGLAAWGTIYRNGCILFLTIAGSVASVPLLWMLSRARPIEPLPVALLGGIGAAGLAAFLLEFFHPVPVTLMDLGFHLAGVALVIGAAALLRRLVLRPA